MITTQALLVLAAIALAMSLWILDLVRRGKLYPGYGIVLIPTIAGAVVVAGVPRARAVVAALLSAHDPVTALTLVAVLVIATLLIYVLSQVTIVANRVTRVVQELAIREAASGDPSKNDRN